MEGVGEERVDGGSNIYSKGRTQQAPVHGGRGCTQDKAPTNLCNLFQFSSVHNLLM